ncbi:MAG: DUF3187 family protein [Planctomycetes bacterium]|nr:DUF3187 family protein [Planctomycetota bacterium]
MRAHEVVASLLVGLGAGCVPAREHFGPMPVRNQHPAQLTVLHMAPAEAAVLPAGGIELRADAAYSSLFLLGSGNGKSWLMDGEYLRASTRARAGLGRDLELALELPFAHTSGGFLDGFLIDYHELFGFPDQNRDVNPQDDFAVEARRSGSTVWQVERDGFEWLDVPVVATWSALASRPNRPGLALRGGLELPTGDQDRGYGNGEVDASFGALADWRSDSVALFAHAQHTFAGTPAPARRQGLTFADVTSLGLAAELPLLEDVHAFAQVEWENSTLRNFGLPVSDRDQVVLWIGGRWQVDTNTGIEVGFGEDLLGKASPDFTAWLGFVWTPGARPVGR